jgi:hypothetical protein
VPWAKDVTQIKRHFLRSVMVVAAYDTAPRKWVRKSVSIFFKRIRKEGAERPLTPTRLNEVIKQA